MLPIPNLLAVSPIPDWPLAQRYAGLECPLYRIFGLLSRKWALDALFYLSQSNEPLRFQELKRRVQKAAQIPLSTKELTARLRELEAAGLVERNAYDDIVPHVDYRLTPRAQSLMPHLKSLHGWLASESQLDGS